MTTTAPAATTEPVLTLLPDTCPRPVTTATESPRLPQLERDRTSESACPRACPSPTRGDQHQNSPLGGPPDAHVTGERRALYFLVLRVKTAGARSTLSSLFRLELSRKLSGPRFQPPGLSPGITWGPSRKYRQPAGASWGGRPACWASGPLRSWP